jgi:hypothetical protein
VLPVRWKEVSSAEMVRRDQGDSMTKRDGNKVAAVADEYVKAAGTARRVRGENDLEKEEAIGQTCGSNLS